MVCRWCVDVLWYVDTHHCLWIVCICGVQCGFDNLCLTVVTLSVVKTIRQPHSLFTYSRMNIIQSVACGP